jgi:hypothetical protein
MNVTHVANNASKLSIGVGTLSSWKVIKDDNVIFEGPIDLVLSYLKRFGDRIKLQVYIRETEVHLTEANFEISRSEQIKKGMKERQLEGFRKHKYFIEDPGYKFCTSCKVSKELELFGYRADSPDGRARQCRDCVNSKAKKRRKRRLRDG